MPPQEASRSPWLLPQPLDVAAHCLLVWRDARSQNFRGCALDLVGAGHSRAEQGSKKHRLAGCRCGEGHGGQRGCRRIDFFLDHAFHFAIVRGGRLEGRRRHRSGAPRDDGCGPLHPLRRTLRKIKPGTGQRFPTPRHERATQRRVFVVPGHTIAAPRSHLKLKDGFIGWAVSGWAASVQWSR